MPVVGDVVFEMLERMGVVEPGQAPHLRFNVNLISANLLGLLPS